MPWLPRKSGVKLFALLGPLELALKGYIFVFLGPHLQLYVCVLSCSLTCCVSPLVCHTFSFHPRLSDGKLSLRPPPRQELQEPWPSSPLSPPQLPGAVGLGHHNLSSAAIGLRHTPLGAEMAAGGLCSHLLCKHSWLLCSVLKIKS